MPSDAKPTPEADSRKGAGSLDSVKWELEFRLKLKLDTEKVIEQLITAMENHPEFSRVDRIRIVVIES